MAYGPVRHGRWGGDSQRTRLLCPLVVQLLVFAVAMTAARAEDEHGLRLTPARLGLVEGDVSFWRPGAGDWEAAQINLPMAAGDALATRSGRFELQIGAAAFVRGGDDTRLQVKSQEPDFLQLEVTEGSVVLDLRELAAGRVVGVDTPAAVLTTTRDGYYRVDVSSESTRVTVRRAGTASLLPAGGHPLSLGTGESVMIGSTGVGQLSVAAAPGFDEWDRWNYERADTLLAAARSPAVAADIYGRHELERHGNWREVTPYGRVWVPFAVASGWAPYTNGRWIWDPYYGWAWVDYAPWGWAPFHYGRWIYNGYWAWAPGPALYAPVYAPALVAFFGPSFGVRVGVPFVSWVALGWGEPVIPWWGGVGFYGVPCWRGWGGPYVVNNVVINNPGTTSAERVNLYRNATAPGGLIGVPKHQFHGVPVQQARLAALSHSDVKPLPGAPRVGGARQVGQGGATADPLRDLAPQKKSVGTGNDFSRRGSDIRSDQSGNLGVGQKAAVDADAFERLHGVRRSARTAPEGSSTQSSNVARDLRRASAPPPRRDTAKAATDTGALQRLRTHNQSHEGYRQLHRSGHHVRAGRDARRAAAIPPPFDSPPKNVGRGGAGERPRTAAATERSPQPGDTARQASHNVYRSFTPPGAGGSDGAGVLRNGSDGSRNPPTASTSSGSARLGSSPARTFGRTLEPSSSGSARAVPKPMRMSNLSRSGGVRAGGSGRSFSR